MSRTKLNPEETRLILEHFEHGRGVSTLAWVYGVDVDTIEDVLRRALHDGKPVPDLVRKK